MQDIPSSDALLMEGYVHVSINNYPHSLFFCRWYEDFIQLYWDQELTLSLQTESMVCRETQNGFEVVAFNLFMDFQVKVEEYPAWVMTCAVFDLDDLNEERAIDRLESLSLTQTELNPDPISREEKAINYEELINTYISEDESYASRLASRTRPKNVFGLKIMTAH